MSASSPVKRALLTLTAVAALAVAIALAGRGIDSDTSTHPSPPVPGPRTAAAELGTITPAYPAGGYLEAGVEVLERIPLSDLPTTAITKTDQTGVCSRIPHDVVRPAEVDSVPDGRDAHACRWTGGHALTITTQPAISMATHVRRTIRAAGRSAGDDRLAHLAWLRIDGHYATEHIAAADPNGTCHVTVDLGEPRVTHVRLHRLGFSFLQVPIDTDPATALARHCPIARAVARNLVRHVEATR